MRPTPTKILVTGGTGALGCTVTRALLDRFPACELLVLTRTPGKYSLQTRVHEIKADLTAENLVIDAPIEMLSDIDSVVHMAADVRWNLALARASAINADGTEKIVNLVRLHCPAVRVFINVSTAYVDAPSHAEQNPYAMTVDNRKFNNTYEYSKWLGEKAVTESGLPWVNVRPSLIVGSEKTGAISSFNGFYHLLRAATQGLLPFVLGDGEARVDLVPVNIVSNAILDALENAAYLEKNVWAISGESAPTVKNLLNASETFVNVFRHASQRTGIKLPAITSPETYRRLFYPLMKNEITDMQERLLQYLDVFQPYLSITAPFAVPPGDVAYFAGSYEHYFPQCIDYWCGKNRGVALSDLHKWAPARKSA